MPFRLIIKDRRARKIFEAELHRRIEEKLDNYPYEEDWGNSWASLDSAKKAAYIEDIQNLLYPSIKENVLKELFEEKFLEKCTKPKTNRFFKFFKNVLSFKSQQKTGNKHIFPNEQV